MNTHAPGPWLTHPADDTLVLAADGSEVAHMSGDYEDRHEWPIMEGNARLIAAAPAMLQAGQMQTAIIRRAQEILTEYLTPDGIDGPEAINRLLGLLDGPDQRAAQSAWDAALATPETSFPAWAGRSVRTAQGNLYEVVRLSENVWQTMKNGTAFTGWQSTENDAKSVAQADWLRMEQNKSETLAVAEAAEGVEQVKDEIK